MARCALGKRSRDDAANATTTHVSHKRTRHGTVYSVCGDNDENQDPREAAEVVTTADAHVQEPREKSRVPLVPVTPSTPRHRNVLGTLPTTPRHAVMSAGKLFKRLTPQSPLSPTTIPNIYQSARQLFVRGAEPEKLIGRDAERAQLARFLRCCSSPTPHGCLYVSGAPGTGKSVMVAEMTRELSGRDGVRCAYINCMSMNSSKDLYATLIAELQLDADAAEADAVSILQQAFCARSSSSTIYQVTLDEMDHILTLDLESLYRVFEWSLLKNSRLVLIGIANALDLTDHFLPRLKSMNMKADLLPFLPYTAAQIRNIIITRLKSLMSPCNDGYVPFLHPAAIELCSRKVSNQTGDLRKAFEICRRAIDLVESETRSKHEDEARQTMLQMTPSKKPLGEKVNGSLEAGAGSSKSVIQITTASLKALTAETAPRASIGHLNKITTAAFGNGTTQRLRALNLQQKAALCALMAYENRARGATKLAGMPRTPTKSHTLAPTIKMLFDTYCQLCTRDSLLYPLSSSEFREVVGSLETLGLVNTVDGKNGSFLAASQTPSRRGRKTAAGSGDERRISSSVSDKDMDSLAHGIGAGILKNMLAGEALD